MAETALEMARRHVALGEGLVAQQRARIASLKAAGHDVVEAERLLELLEQTQALFVADLKRLMPKT
jgi:hypothetical protein